ncbi:MAG: hypothetical protein RLZZ450_2679 [Pseudomonadota bacterium]
MPLVVLAASACALDARDLDAFRHTAAGPEKLHAVLHDASRPTSLRAEAALRLLDLERADVDGRKLLFASLEALSPADRGQLAPTLERGLSVRMSTARGEPPTPRAVLAKDSAARLLPLLDEPERGTLGRAVLRWVGADLDRRADVGAFALEAITARVGAASAEPSAESLSAELSPKSFARLTDTVAKYADPSTRSAAAAKIVAVEQAYRSTPNHETALAEYALPALGRFVDTEGARARLVSIAADARIELAQRSLALELVRAHVRTEDVEALSTIVLDESAPLELRLRALERVGETGAREALPCLLTLITSRSRELRQPAGQLAIAIGGERSVSDVLNALPQHWNVNYPKSEIEAYVAAIQALPSSSFLVTTLGRKLYAYNWWPRVIAIRYLAGRASVIEATWRLKLHADDPKEIVGDEWPPAWTVGREVQNGLKQLASRS